MRAFKTRMFSRWARREALPDRDLWQALLEMQAGLIDAHLGSGLVKKRIRRAGHGKRGGYRTLVATNFHDRWFFLYGFAKNDRENISDSDLAKLRSVAAALLNMDNRTISEAQAQAKLVEVDHGKQETT